MNKKWRQAAALGLAAAMMITVLPGDIQAGAKKNSVKLSTSSINVKVGNTKKVKISNSTGKKVKTVTCKVTKGKKMVTVRKKTKKYITIKGVKAGTANIQVTVKTTKKKYTLKLKVTVKENKKEDTAAKDTTDTGNATNQEEKKEDTVDTGKAEVIESDVNDDGTVRKSVVRISAANPSRQLYGKLYRPSGDDNGPYPAVVLTHGYNGTADDWVDDCRYYTKNGYICYSIDCCGGSTKSRSRGLDSTEMTIFTERDDVIAAFDMLYNRPDVDKNRVFLFGGSQGGMVSAMAAEERADKVRALAMYFPALVIPDQWRNAINDPTRFKNNDVLDFMGLKLGRVFSESLQDYYTEKELGKNFQNPVYILHGSADAMIPVSSSEKAVKEYYGEDQAKLMILPNECHGFYPAGRKTGREEVLKFMEENK